MILNGSVNTLTASDLEKELQGSLEGVENLVFDFSGVEYVSSAGIRVFMATYKIMSKQGTMVMKNVNDDVMEVFEVTGLNDVFTIQ